MMLDSSGWTDKDSAVPEYRQLYEEHGYIQAYRRHTDLRVARDPRAAIGVSASDPRQGWEEHGQLQLDFLRRAGLEPDSSLLDVGCGTGRLARKAVPYLQPGRYTGIDISPAALEHARRLSIEEGWGRRAPRFVHGDGTLRALAGGSFDLVWAHSVVTHLPPDAVRELLAGLHELTFGAFWLTYKQAPGPRRSGLKQFQYPAWWLGNLAAELGLRAETSPVIWPAGQCTLVIRP